MTPTETVRARLVPLMRGECPSCGTKHRPGYTQAEVTRQSGLASRHVIRRFLRGDTIMTSNLDAISVWMDGVEHGRE